MGPQDDSHTVAAVPVTLGTPGHEASPDRPGALQLPATISRYQLTELLGTGGAGAVYRAIDPELDRPVAIKLLNPRGTAEGDPARATERLLREGQALAKVSHPNLVQVFDVGTYEDGVFIVMELVEGDTLSRWLRAHRRGWREVVELFASAGQGLAAAHHAGLVHRDFKPHNVALDERGHAIVLDFGLAVLAGEPMSSAVESPTDVSREPLSATSRLTKTGTVMGTPAYMAPEQHRGEAADARTDQYAFCVALYEALFGQRPFSGRDAEDLYDNKEGGRMVETPSPNRVPHWLDQAVLRGLSPAPSDRWPTMDALLAALGRGRRFKRARWLAVSAIGSALAVWVALLLVDEDKVCIGAEHHLEQVWDQPRRERARAAFLATGVSYADPSWQRVAARLDDYAIAWIAAHREACEATAIRHEQSTERMDRRMACLARGSAKLAALVGVLEQADARIVERSVQATAGLRAPDDCLASDAGSALDPTDPVTAAQVDTIREQIAEAGVLRFAARYDEALDHARKADALAADVEFAPVEAELLQLAGQIQADTGNYEAAQDLFERAYFLASQARALDTSAAAATLMIRVAVERADAKALERWTRNAQAAVDAGGSNDRIRSSLLYAQGNASYWKGDFEAADSYHRQALKLRLAAFGTDGPGVGGSLNELGSAAFAAGDTERARTYYSRARASWERVLGPDHPQVSAPVLNLGNVALSRGDAALARALYQDALDIREHGYGPDHPSLVEPLINLGLALTHLGEIGPARAPLERAIELIEPLQGAEHPMLAAGIVSLGVLALEAGDTRSARVLHERALWIHEKAFGPDHPQYANSLGELGRVFLELGELERAIETLTRALEVFDGAGMRQTHVAELRFSLARALVGDAPERAIKLAREAASELDHLGGPPELLSEVASWIEAHK